MKFSQLPTTARAAIAAPLCTVLLGLFAACDGDDPTRAGALRPASSDRIADPTRFEPARGAPGGLESDSIRALRERADEAFAELGGPTARSESQIGPQPWPADLPERWPRPDQARVVADSRRVEGERLLLVDLPDAPDRALARYRTALEAGGFRVSQPRTRRVRHALHAMRGEDEAVLTFIQRERTTRLEILFLHHVSG